MNQVMKKLKQKTVSLTHKNSKLVLFRKPGNNNVIKIYVM